MYVTILELSHDMLFQIGFANRLKTQSLPVKAFFAWNHAGFRAPS